MLVPEKETLKHKMTLGFKEHTAFWEICTQNDKRSQKMGSTHSCYIDQKTMGALKREFYLSGEAKEYIPEEKTSEMSLEGCRECYQTKEQTQDVATSGNINRC